MTSQAMVEGEVFIVDLRERTAKGHVKESSAGRERRRLNMAMGWGSWGRGRGEE